MILQPEKPIIGSSRSKILFIKVIPNPYETENVEYVIFCDSEGAYVQIDGTLGIHEVWQSKEVWGCISLRGLTFRETYTFRTQARNILDSLQVSTFSQQAKGIPYSYEVDLNKKVISFNTLIHDIQKNRIPQSWDSKKISDKHPVYSDMSTFLGGLVRRKITGDGKYMISHYYDDIDNRWYIFRSKLDEDFVSKNFTRTYNTNVEWRNSKQPIVGRTQYANPKNK